MTTPATPEQIWVESRRRLIPGTVIGSIIEWYDKYCLKVNRTGAANLLIYKPSIKYMYKESEAVQRR